MGRRGLVAHFQRRDIHLLRGRGYVADDGRDGLFEFVGHLYPRRSRAFFHFLHGIAGLVDEAGATAIIAQHAGLQERPVIFPLGRIFERRAGLADENIG